jgi:hypothetical protein
MMTRSSSIFLFLLTAVMVAGCRERGRQAAASDPGLFVELTVTASNESPLADATLFWREEDQQGAGRALGEKESVLLDGKPLEVDSALVGGVFYRQQLPVETAEGSHRLELKRGADRVSQLFTLRPFVLEAPSAPLRRGEPLLLRTGEEAGSRARFQVALTDTAFLTDDLFDVFTAEEGMIRIPADRLKALSTGPLFLQVQREEVTPFLVSPRFSGNITTRYGLQQQLELR